MTSRSAGPGLGRDFRLFLGGQLLSQMGSSITLLLLPLIVFQLTGSAVNLALTSAAEYVPYLLFGLVIGAYVDRLPRRQLMIVTDVVRAAVIVTIPILSELHALRVWWIYVAGFLGSTLAIAFNTAEQAALPNLVSGDDLVAANGRVQAVYSGSAVVGPLVGGALLVVISSSTILWVDGVSFIVSALTLLAVRRGFDSDSERRTTRVGDDVVEGLRYVLRHPVLRSISLMMAMVNFVASTTYAQIVFFAKRRLDASDSEVGWLFAAGSLGVVVFGLAAGWLRRRWSFSWAALGSIILTGAVTVAFAAVRWYPLALVLWAVGNGLSIFFNINTSALRQSIVPPEMLGRVFSIAGVLAWSAIPVGTLLGGLLVSATGNVAAVYAGIGVLTMIIGAAFILSPIGHAHDHVTASTTTRAAAPPG